MGDLYNPFPKLPKNVRQIGDPDQVVRLYVEDYVNTYLKRLYPSGRQTMRVGVLLGSVEQYDGTPYIFIDGAMELEAVGDIFITGIVGSSRSGDPLMLQSIRLSIVMRLADCISRSICLGMNVLERRVENFWREPAPF